MAHTLTLRLDEETDAALKDMKKAEPKKAIADLIREAITEKRACVYFIRRSDGAVRIGFTGSLRTRLSTIGLEVGDVKLEAALPGGRAEVKALHTKLKKARVAGEWFRGELVEAEIRAVLDEWGSPDGSEGLRVLSLRLPPSIFDDLQARVDTENARLRALGGIPSTTVGGYVRKLIEGSLGSVANGAGEQEALGSDETTVREPVHRKRVPKGGSGVGEPVESTTKAPVGPPDDIDMADLDAMLEGTNL